MNWQKAILAGGASVALVALTSCGAAGEQSDKDAEKVKMNMQQAGDRAEALLTESIEAVVPAVQWDYFSSNEVACSGNLNEATGTTTVKRTRIITTKISEQRRGNFLGVVQGNWEKKGYELTGADADKDMPSLFAKTQDGFTISVEIGYKGAAYFSIASPCASDSPLSFPNGTPGKPGRPDAKVDQVPRHESEFWSSVKPLHK
ncbi:hypothetical protein ACR820_14120 [Streptomyces netropsis]